MHKPIVLTFLLLLVMGCKQAPEPKVATEDAGALLHAALDETWDFAMAEDPLHATRSGVHDYNDKLPQYRPEDLKRRYDFARDMLTRIAAIDRSQLEHNDRISYDIFKMQLETRVSEYELETHLIPFTSDTGFHVRLAMMPSGLPLATVKDYDNYLARLQAAPAYIQQHIDLLKTGLEKGITQPQMLVDKMMNTFSGPVSDKVADSLFYQPFTRIPESFTEEDRKRLSQAAEQAIPPVSDAYRKLAAFMQDQYKPGARTAIGAYQAPDGKARYTFWIKHYTTLDKTAEEIHQIGLDEVKRIRAEMDAVIAEVGFKGSFDEFLTFLRTDERFYAKTPEELMAAANAHSDKIRKALPDLFGRLPKRPFIVEPVPEHLAPNYTAGRYVSASKGSDKPGKYWVNTHNLPSRPLYALEALTLHEAVPGHHMQSALTQEMEHLPKFRQVLYLSAFGEGWGLYSEFLGLEAGFYTDPYSNFGRLTYEMWRACRLVVDTGIHAMEWSREDAVNFMKTNTALSLHEVGTEIDRYISWPGQALSYKMGEIEIRALRGEAEEKLGDRFDLKTFHDRVLRNGTVPLPILRKEIEAYMAE